MLTPRKCIAVTWDNSNRIYGIAVDFSRKNKRKTIRDAIVLEADDSSFPEQLSKICKYLNPSESSKLIMGGALKGSVCFELDMPNLPKSEMEAALGYEIGRHIPVPLEQMLWSFRILEKQSGISAGKTRVRIHGVPEINWNHLLSQITASGVKVDMIISPYMAIDPFLQSKNIFLSEVNPAFSFDRLASGGRAMRPLQESPVRVEKIEGEYDGLENLSSEGQKDLDISLFYPAMILADFVLDAASRRSINTLHLPAELRPVRFYFMRTAAIYLAVGILVLAGGLGVRNWLESSKQISMIRDEKRKIQKSISELQQKILAASEFDKLLDEINNSSAGNREILNCLYHISKTLPPEMWVTSFKSKDNEISITIKTNGETGNFPEKLNRLGIFTTHNIKKRRNSDGSLDIFLEVAYAAQK